MTSCCHGFGVIRLRYHSGEPDDYGLCLCAAGLALRDDTNAGRATGYALWQAWASRNQVDPARVFLIEELLDDLEMAAKFPTWTPDASLPATGTDAIAAAMRSHKAKL